ncbi:MAG TPA: type II CAAX endopeptidase family protein [Pyrinomonadaceae bacterium]|jgi:hypothetical protein
MPDFFYNGAGRLRSVWRLAAFTVAYMAATSAGFVGVDVAAALVLPPATYRWLLIESWLGFAVQSIVLFVPAALVGWGCARFAEELPWRSLGWAPHRGWMRDALFGLLVGAAAVCLAALVGLAAGGYSFRLVGGADAAAVARTLVTSAVVFMLGAAAEEMLFRGYPFQTLLRSWPVWAALLPVSLPFALVHLANPNVAPGFTFLNTALAGVWLGVAYWRTRSLWFPFAAHAGWNWAQGAVLGSPVSGITKITPDPLLRFADSGPHWLGGGAYGIEGGAACTLALVAATLFVWRTRLLSATPELRQYTDGENPNPDAGVAPSVVRADAAAAGAGARVHLVYLRPEGMLITKKQYADWRQIQDEHENFMTSLGPFDEEDVLDFFENQYGADEARWGVTRAEIRRFMASDETTLSL